MAGTRELPSFNVRGDDGRLYKIRQTQHLIDVTTPIDGPKRRDIGGIIELKTDDGWMVKFDDETRLTIIRPDGIELKAIVIG